MCLQMKSIGYQRQVKGQSGAHLQVVSGAQKFVALLSHAHVRQGLEQPLGKEKGQIQKPQAAKKKHELLEICEQSRALLASHLACGAIVRQFSLEKKNMRVNVKEVGNDTFPGAP